MKILAITAVLASCTSAPSPRIQAAANVWQLICPIGNGSALPVAVTDDEILFLTAGHMGQAWGGEWTVKTRDGRTLTGGKALSSHPTEDAMLIAFSAPEKAIPLHAIDYSPLTLGEQVYGAGWGGGYGLWLTTGLVSDMDRVSSGISPGDSGGGIFNTAGELVAMMLGSGPACHHAYVVPMADLQEWLQPLL